MATNFHLAVVLIDIQTVYAALIFDGAASAVTGDATITYSAPPRETP